MIEDAAEVTLELPADRWESDPAMVETYSWKEIDAELPEPWIISRCDSGIRAFGFWRAWQAGSRRRLHARRRLRPCRRRSRRRAPAQPPRDRRLAERARLRGCGGLPYRDFGGPATRGCERRAGGQPDLDSIRVPCDTAAEAGNREGAGGGQPGHAVRAVLPDVRDEPGGQAGGSVPDVLTRRWGRGRPSRASTTFGAGSSSSGSAVTCGGRSSAGSLRRASARERPVGQPRAGGAGHRGERAPVGARRGGDAERATRRWTAFARSAWSRERRAPTLSDRWGRATLALVRPVRRRSRERPEGHHHRGQRVPWASARRDLRERVATRSWSSIVRGRW